MDSLINNLLPVSIESEMKRSYLDYAMSVIVSRAIPDVRDGLKPVHRRILYAMYESGYHANKPYRKSARIVGDVIGKYHPHGDAAIYDSLVRMAQSFSLRAPLVDGQGNFGSIDGDAPASMRYTESRLMKISHHLLEDIDKDTVDFNPNYDGSEQEPGVLPAMFPNLLVNGSGGIAVGMATNIPPHNLGEVIDACCQYVDNNNIDITELLTIIKGPDFPTSGIIVGNSGIKSAYLTGRGSVLIRGKTDIENIANNRQAIIISEIPYMVNKAKLVEKIAELVNEKRLEGISDLRDESNKLGIRIVVELKKDTNAEVLLNQLYSYTPLQTTFGVNMLALDEGMPRVMNLKEVIVAFVKFREIVITRRTIYLLNKARDKAHILLGLRIAVSNIDAVIKIIRGSSDPNEAKQKLTSTAFNAEEVIDLLEIINTQDQVNSNVVSNDKKQVYLTEIQAKAILEMRLQRLTAMEKNKLSEDLKLIAEEIKGYVELLNSREKLLILLKEELRYVKNNFATPRLTAIEEHELDQDLEDLIPREDMVVTVTLGGYIKRVPLDTYKAQNRGGKGRMGASIRDEDAITQIFVGVTHTPMLFFSNIGKVYSLKLYKLPLGTPQSKGRPLVNLLSLDIGEHITNIMPLPENQDEWDNLNIIFATSTGNVRRNNLSDFKNIRSNGKIALKLDDNAKLVNVKVCKEEDHIFLATKKGKAIRFPVSAARVFKGRKSDGIRGMKLTGDDRVIAMTILQGMKASIIEREAYLSIPIEQRISIASSNIQLELQNQFDLQKLANENISVEKIIEMAEAEEFILTITENGIGKKTSAYEYRVTNRGGSGILNILMSSKTGEVVSVMPVTNYDELMLITNTGKLIRCKLDNVRSTGRSTSGVILFKTDKDEQVVSASLIIANNEEEG